MRLPVSSSLIKSFVFAGFLLAALLFSGSAFLPFPVSHELKKGVPLLIGDSSYQTIEGIIQVPEDYNKPQGRMITLPFYIVKSNNAHPAEPVFWLDGGPGASNILTPKKIATGSPHSLLAAHDLVCVGYRGVDGSSVLKSEQVNKAMRGLHHRMLSDESLKNMEQKMAAYHAQLRKEGVDVNCYTIMQVIEDIEQVRKVLGYQKINLLTVSYGTRVAMIYSYIYPQVLNRTVMIGACPPGYFLPRPEQAERILTVYDSLYQLEQGSHQKGSIREAMRKSFQNLPKRWAGFRLDADKIKAGTVMALYARNFAVTAFDAYFKAANNGDYSGLYFFQKIHEMNNNQIIGEMLSKTVSADLSDSTDFTSYRNTNHTTILGNNMSLVYQTLAAQWPVKPIPAEFSTCRNSDAETLVISGGLDFRTPPEVTNRELMPFLSRGHHVVLDRLSHSDILMQIMKSPDFLALYFDQGVVDESKIKTPGPLNFKPKSKISKSKLYVMGLLM